MVKTIHIPSNFNVKAAYPLALVSESWQPDIAQEFVEFVLSAQGQTVLSDHGFQPLQLKANVESEE